MPGLKPSALGRALVADVIVAIVIRHGAPHIVGGQSLGTVAKQLAGAGVDGVAAGVDLPTANGDIDIERVKLGAEAAAAGFLGGDQTSSPSP